MEISLRFEESKILLGRMYEQSKTNKICLENLYYPGNFGDPERKKVSTEITFCNLPIYFLKWQDLINVSLKTSKNDPSAFVTAAELGNMETIKWVPFFFDNLMSVVFFWEVSVNVSLE